MSQSQSEGVLRGLHHLLKSGGASADDGRLLERYVRQHDQEAFAELVARHGPLVFGLCRRVLRDAHDAEDVFQATFLVLARKAASIRKPSSLSCYLHGIAYRLALRAKTEAAQRRTHERRVSPAYSVEDSDLSWREVRALIDEELQRLPMTQRLPLILCYLEGQTQDEAARQLGWPRGTLKRRLERGRERLRLRLTRRGVSLGAGLFAAALTASTTRGTVPALLRMATVRAGMGFLLDEAGAIAATQAGLLAEGALRAALSAKLKLGAMLILLLGCISTATGLAIRQTPAAKEPETSAEAPAQPRPIPAEQGRKDRDGDALPEEAAARLGTLHFRHEMPVLSMVLTRDGKNAIAADTTGALICWDVGTGREIRRFENSPTPVYSMAVSPDGKTLALGTPSDLFLREAATGKTLSYEPVKVDPVIAQLLFTPDGKTLILRDRNSIHLWDIVQHKEIHVLKGCQGNVACMALSPNGKTLASGGRKDPHVYLWDVASGKERCRFAAHEKDVLTLAFSPNGQTLACAGNPASLAFFDAVSGKKLHVVSDYGGMWSLDTHPDETRAAAYSPDGKMLFDIEKDVVQVRDAASGKRLRPFDKSDRHVTDLLLSADGKTIATFGGRYAHAFDLWDAASGKRLHDAPGHQNTIATLAFTTDGKTLFSTTGVQEPARWWSVDAGESQGSFGDNPDGIGILALSPDGKLLAASGYDDHTIRLLDPAKHKELRVLKGHTSTPLWITWSASGKLLASGTLFDGTIRLWDTGTGKETRVIAFKHGFMTDLTLSPDGKHIAVAGEKDGGIRIFSAETGEEVRKIPTPPRLRVRFAFSPDGMTLASSNFAGELVLWNAATGQPVRRWETRAGWIARLAFSRDGRSMISGQGDHSVRLWEVATGQERACFRGHRSAVSAVAFFRDGRRIASGSYDTTILLWDATRGARPEAARTVEQLRALWADLEGTDAGRAYRAMWQLAVSPRISLPFLAERLRPVVPLDAVRRKQIEHLLADLDREAFAVRQKAEAELEKMGEAIEPVLRRAIEGKPSLEVRRRIEKLLEKVTGLSGERLRALRALEALEHMNTPEARRLLDKLASGEAQAWLTQEARATRKRMER